MASLLIRNVDDALHARLKAAAARHHRSLEEEARELLRCAVAQPDETQVEERLTDIARRLFGPEHGVDLDIPPRDAAEDRPPLDFSGPEWDALTEAGDEQATGPAGGGRGGPAA